MVHLILKETGGIKPRDEDDFIRIDLTDDEIKRIIDGHTIQTQYPWLSIGRKL